MDETHPNHNGGPNDHDERQPDAGSQALQHHVGRDLGKDIGREKDRESSIELQTCRIHSQVRNESKKTSIADVGAI